MSRIGWSREMRLLSRHFRDSMKDNFSNGWGGRGRLKGGLISNTNRNKSPRELASILPFSSWNWQNRKIIPRVWSGGSGGRESAWRTWFFNGEGRRKYLEILLHFNPTRFVRFGLLATIYERNLTKETRSNAWVFLNLGKLKFRQKLDFFFFFVISNDNCNFRNIYGMMYLNNSFLSAS